MDKEEIVNWLEQYCPTNKARGLLAQLKLVSEFRNGVFSRYSSKFYKGCWVLAPKDEEFYKARFCFFVHEKEAEHDIVSHNAVNPNDILGDAESIRFKMIAGFMSRAGVITIYAFYTGENWSLFYYNKNTEDFRKLNPEEFFGKWPGRGRPGRNRRAWDDNLREEYLKMDRELLVELYLYEKFYTDFLKGTYRVSVKDPYDIDGFILSPSLPAVIPVEIKEKFPGEESSGEKYFGIDVGRILMLLRFCLPTEANAFYIVREVRNDEARTFVSWKYVPLSDIIMTVSWNPLGGGRGMGGQETHTIKIPYRIFRVMMPESIADVNLQRVKSFPDNVKKRAEEFYKYVTSRYIVY